MNDDFESFLRSRLKTIHIGYDETRADEMIGLATASSPLPERRNVLAPLATAAAVVAVGTTVAVVVSTDDAGPDRSQGAAPPASTSAPAGTAAVPSVSRDGVVEVDLVYALRSTRTGNSFTRPRTVPDLKVKGSNYDPAWGSALSSRHVEIDRIRIDNGSSRDAATVRLTRGGRTILTRDLAGVGSADIDEHLDATASPIGASIQCRKPARGDTCSIEVRVHGIQYIPLPASRSSVGPAPSRTGTAPTTPPSTGVYEPPVPRSTTNPAPRTGPSCPNCQIP